MLWRGEKKNEELGKRKLIKNSGNADGTIHPPFCMVRLEIASFSALGKCAFNRGHRPIFKLRDLRHFTHQALDYL